MRTKIGVGLAMVFLISSPLFAGQKSRTIKSRRPDLSLYAVSLNPRKPCVDDVVTFSAQVKNTGTAAAAASKLSLRIGGGTPVILSLPAIDPGKYATVTKTESLSKAQRYRVTAKAEGLRREANQYANANALMIFQTEHGRRISLLTSAVLAGDTGWEPLVVTAIAPQASARVVVGIFASMTGTVTFDAAQLTIASTDRTEPDARRAAFDALRLHLAQTYPFFGLEGKPKHAFELKPDAANAAAPSWRTPK